METISLHITNDTKVKLITSQHDLPRDVHIFHSVFATAVEKSSLGAYLVHWKVSNAIAERPENSI